MLPGEKPSLSQSQPLLASEGETSATRTASVKRVHSATPLKLVALMPHPSTPVDRVYEPANTWGGHVGGRDSHGCEIAYQLSLR